MKRKLIVRAAAAVSTFLAFGGVASAAPCRLDDSETKCMPPASPASATVKAPAAKRVPHATRTHRHAKVRIPAKGLPRMLSPQPLGPDQ